jgi:hypothetical protein
MQCNKNNKKTDGELRNQVFYSNSPTKMTTEVDIALPDTLNSAWKNDKKGFGFKMLQKMGWKEENGLGKSQNGIKSHIHVRKREEGLGLGMEHMKDDVVGSKAWSSTLSSYSEVLELLKSEYVNSNSSENSEVGDEEVLIEKKKKKKDNKEKKSKKRSREEKDETKEKRRKEDERSSSQEREGKKSKKADKPIITTRIR